jgi:Domain of unknown function (DUF4126)
MLSPSDQNSAYSDAMDLISTLFGVSFASGLNVYATVLAMGVLHRLGVLHLPQSLDVIATLPVMAGAALLYAVEFVADKVPYLDTVWDGVHTFIRPAAGAFLAFSMVGHVDPKWQVLAALLGGSIALTSHAAKASTRAAANVSPEPFSNWALSLTEDGIAFLLVWLVGSHPVIGLVLALLLTVAAIIIVWKLSRLIRRVFRRAA